MSKKTGARNRKDDRGRIRDIRKNAMAIVDHSMELEPTNTDTIDMLAGDTDIMPTTKSLSLNEIQSSIYSAWNEKYPSGGIQVVASDSWVVDVYPEDDFAIICQDGKYYQVDYTIDDKEQVTFSDNRIEVIGRQVWEAVTKSVFLGRLGAQAQPQTLNISYVKSLGLSLTDDQLLDRLAVKSIGKDEIRHYPFVWGGPNMTDVEREYFKSDTNFWDGMLGKNPRPLTWDHAQDESFKAPPIIGQTVEWGDDELGRWAISKLDQAHKYRGMIDGLIKSGALGSSSDSAPQYIERLQTGKSTWLKTWPWFATALTNLPAEPRTVGSLEFLKSIGVSFPDTDAIRLWEWQSAKMKIAKSKFYVY